MKQPSTICVTGGTGFVGVEVVSQFLKDGCSVRCLVRNERSAEKLSTLKKTYTDQLQLITGNILNPSDISIALEGSSALVHLAGIRRKEAKAAGLTYEDVDVGSAVASAVALQQRGIKRVLLLSAGAIGKSYYVKCKAKAERAIIDAKLDWTIFRPAFIVGPGQQWPVIMSPVLSAMGLVPGSFGETARKSGNISRYALAKAFLMAFQDEEYIGKILEVPEIRRMTHQKP